MEPVQRQPMGDLNSNIANLVSSNQPQQTTNFATKSSRLTQINPNSHSLSKKAFFNNTEHFMPQTSSLKSKAPSPTKVYVENDEENQSQYDDMLSNADVTSPCKRVKSCTSVTPTTPACVSMVSAVSESVMSLCYYNSSSNELDDSDKVESCSLSFVGTPSCERLPVDDTEMLDEYCFEILSNLINCEQEHQPKALYMNKQKEINSVMRSRLVDWLVEVQDEYKLHSETFYLAVHLLDKFLSRMLVNRAKLQLLGTTCLMIAAKFEEIYPPDVEEFAYVTADTYTVADILKMERMVLKVAKCKVAIPTIQQYLSIFHQKSSKLTPFCLFLSSYFSDLTQSHEKFLQFTPSVKAAAALSLAILTEDLSFENKLIKCKSASVEIHSDVTRVLSLFKDQIHDCAMQIASYQASQQVGKMYITEKYCKPDNKRVAELPPVVHLPGFLDVSKDQIISIWCN